MQYDSRCWIESFYFRNKYKDTPHFMLKCTVITAKRGRYHNAEYTTHSTSLHAPDFSNASLTWFVLDFHEAKRLIIYKFYIIKYLHKNIHLKLKLDASYLKPKFVKIHPTGEGLGAEQWTSDIFTKVICMHCFNTQYRHTPTQPFTFLSTNTHTVHKHKHWVLHKKTV